MKRNKFLAIPRNSFGMPIEKKYRTTPKKKVDCFARKVDFFSQNRSSQYTFCCNDTKVLFLILSWLKICTLVLFLLPLHCQTKAL